jgi:hypothetical protein
MILRKGKAKYQRHFIYHRSHTNDLDSNPGLCRERMATNRLSHGTAYFEFRSISMIREKRSILSTNFHARPLRYANNIMHTRDYRWGKPQYTSIRKTGVRERLEMGTLLPQV